MTRGRGRGLVLGSETSNKLSERTECFCKGKQGTIDRTLHEITNRLHNPTPERKREIQRRTNILNRLHPTEYILGRGMNSRYFGAKFGENIVVFENMDYGNALYILFDNWQEISQMSRIDILKRHERDFIRIIHKNGWEKAIKRHIDELKAHNE